MLKGTKVVLRPLSYQDMDKTLNWRNDPLMNQLTLGVRFPKTREMELEWYSKILEDKSNRFIFLGIVELTSNELIGITQLTNIDYISGTCDFGILIPDEEKQGKGFAYEAINLLFDYAKNSLNLRKISLNVVDYNKRAIDLYLRINFKQEGILKQHVYYNREYHDVHILSIFL